MNTKIVSCTCKNETQDKLHGKGKRVYNKMRNGNYKCTVCQMILPQSK